MFSGLGESLSNPNLEDFLRQLSNRKISSCVITNALAMTPARQESLISAGISQFQVSLHGISDKTNRAIVSKGANLSRVKKHLENLATIRPMELRVQINFVETADNEFERVDVQRFAQALGFDFFPRRVHSRGGTVASGRMTRKFKGCGIFGAVTFISSDGDILPCVNDVQRSGLLGNVRDTTWNLILAEKRRVIESNAWFEMCDHCNDDYRWVLLADGGLVRRD